MKHYKRGLIALAALLALPLVSYAGSIKSGDWVATCQGQDLCMAQMNSEGPRVFAGWNKVEKGVRIGALVPAVVGKGQPITIWLNDQDTTLTLVTNECSENYCLALVDASSTEMVSDMFRRAIDGLLVYPENGSLQLSKLSMRGFKRAYADVEKGAGKPG